MINKKNILAIATLICLTFVPADASSLVQMDIKKTSDNAVDVTFYATGVNGNPIVTRKSNNKYVVLMPNIASGSVSTPDLSSVKDLISDVNVKNVDDGMSGYTKVTFITTKPVNIKTYMQKAAPLTQEEKEAKSLIAQVKTHPKQTVAPEAPKKETPVTKVTSSTGAPKIQAPVQKVSKPAPEKVEPIVQVKQTVKELPKNSVQTEPEKPLLSETSKTQVENKFDIKEVEKIEKTVQSKMPKQSSNAGWMVVVLPLLALYLLFRMIRNSVQKSNALKASFAENLAEKPYIKENYDDIINDSELNWQERYQKFVQESNGNIKNRKYNFIKTDDALNEIDKKRLELENTLSKTPDIYEHHEIDISDEPTPEVQSEDDVIQKDFREIKLKAFAKPVSLHTTHRNMAKKALPKMPRMKEGKFVKLENNALNATKRRFSNANLNVSDLIKTGSQYIPEGSQDINMIENEQNYIMSSLDEYFALLDKEQTKNVTRPDNDLSKRVAASLAQVKPSMKMRKTHSNVSSNPIEKKNEDYLNGLIVKSGYNIDENRGFYLVSLDGVTALVGRVKEEIFVLKKFDENVDRLQVRLDSENVYMVKAGDFKSLVDVDEEKMGVLIEL